MTGEAVEQRGAGGGDGVPQWVEDDFRAYLPCGILAHGGEPPLRLRPLTEDRLGLCTNLGITGLTTRNRTAFLAV